MLIFFSSIPAGLSAGGQKDQEVSPSSGISNNETGGEEQTPPDDQSVYRINNIEVNVEGKTKPFVVKKAGKIRVGTLIYGTNNLDTYIGDKRQFLDNQRVFEEAKLEYILGEPDENHQIPVDLVIFIKDSRNFIAFPAPKYDSNEGFSLSLAGRDFNFLGSMNPFEADIGYERDTDGNNGFVFGFDALVPFELGGFVWTFDFENNFEFMQNTPTYYDNHIGLLMDLPFKETTFTFGLYESIFVNEENEDRDKASDGDYFKDGWYLNTLALARWNIPTGLQVSRFGELEYTPEVDFSINYRPGGDIGDSRRGFETTLKQYLGFGDVNWIGNFRQGLVAAIESSNTYNFFSSDWDNELFLTGIYHEVFTLYTGFSGRIRWAQWFNEYYDEAGDAIRGIPDKKLCADYMLSFNLQESFLLFRFMPSIWFNNPKLRIMNFEEHITPFIDMALVQDPVNNRSFNFEDMVVTAGIELTTYPFAFRTAYFRVSFGVDLREFIETGKWPDGDHRELYVGLGHYF